jgi:hypothetical protein
VAAAQLPLHRLPLAPAECSWLFALLARLEPPLLGGTLATVRDLHVLARRVRSAAAAAAACGGSGAEEARARVAALAVLLAVTGRAFHQAAETDE